jgi:hypothetical protein
MSLLPLHVLAMQKDCRVAMGPSLSVTETEQAVNIV